ncbi:hypothetical protein ACNQFZ_12885 [Schinkia sp. CFF1]
MSNMKASSGKKVGHLSDIIFLIFVVLLSIFSGITILFDTLRPDYYVWLPMLPICFGLINILSFKAYKNIFNKLTNIVVISLYTIRNVVTPLIMMFGNYYGAFKVLNSGIVNKAITLMIYESFIVFIFLAWRSSKVVDISRGEKSSIESYTKKKIKIFGLAIFLIILLCVFAYIKVPEIKTSYVSIFEGDKLVTLLGTSEQLVTGTVDRILFTLFNFFFAILQIFIPLFLIYQLRNKFGDRFFPAIISCFVAFSNLLFMTNETAYTLLVIIVLFIVILKLYPKNKIRLILTSGLTFIFILLNIYLLKSRDVYLDSTPLENTSFMFQAYFPGVSNLAGVFNINNSSKLTTLFFDFYAMIPFRSTLFGLENDMRLVSLYTYQNNAPANIIPAIGQAYHYLGFLLSPLVSVFFVNTAYKFQEKLRDQTNLWMYCTWLFLAIYSSVAPIMYNFTIFGARFFFTILPMLMLAKYSSNRYRIFIER